MLSELLTVSSCSVCAERRCHEYMTQSKVKFYSAKVWHVRLYLLQNVIYHLSSLL